MIGMNLPWYQAKKENDADNTTSAEEIGLLTI
jgi:hypothetical protein